MNSILIDILKDQVKPALGCTEPGAVAFCAARAAELLPGEVEKMELVVNNNILKNGMGVGIPGTAERGLDFAAALGICCGNSKYGLEVLKTVNDDCIERSKIMVSEERIKVILDKDLTSLYIKASAWSGADKSEVVIKDSHTNIVMETLNGDALFSSDKSIESATAPKSSNEGIKFRIKDYSIDQLIQFAAECPVDDLGFINDGIQMNLSLAKVGITEDIGIGIGKHFKAQIKDAESKAKAFTVAASEARMSGYPLPVMSSAGSGNHGLVTIIPIAVIGNEIGMNNEAIIRSVALSHLVTIFVKVHLGVLTPVCGCGVAAGVGCSAGMSFLKGGSNQQIKASINNMIAGVSGMLCDGAKLGCAYKLAISVDAAMDASSMALAGIFIPSDNGILGETPEESIRNMAHVSVDGMNNTDDAILDVMIEKCI
jgi:L-cysteine desulfidase